MKDFTKDGITYCGKCKEPKEKILYIGNKTIKPHCMCKCEREKAKKREAEELKIKNLKKIEQNRNICFESPEQMAFTFESDDKLNELSTIARNYVDKFEELNNTGLVLYGSVGTGKTFIACCIANALIDKGYTCLITNFPKIVNELQGTFEKQKYIDRLVEFDLLIIDDLASERKTEFMNEMVTNVIDSRYRNGKPVIITTNLTAQEMEYSEDVNRQRIYSRLYEMCMFYQVKGKDRRVNKQVEYKNILEELKND